MGYERLKRQLLLGFIPVLFLAGGLLINGPVSAATVTIAIIGFVLYGIIYFCIIGTIDKMTNPEDKAKTVDGLQVNRSEMFHDLNIVIKKFDSLIKSQTEQTHQLIDNYEHFASLFEEFSAGSNEQMSGMGKVNKQLEKMYDLSQNINSGSKEILALSLAAKDTSNEGKEAVNTATGQMERVVEISQKVNDLILSLESEARRISEIVGLINEISDQTNLLALNASIEAARAGEHGRGFAVVADEVRKLADNSANSTEMIMQVINQIKTLVEDTVQSMQQGMDEVNEGKKVIKKAGESILSLDQVVNNASAKGEYNLNQANSILEQTQTIWDIQENTTSIASNFSEASLEAAKTVESKMYLTDEVLAKSKQMTAVLEELETLLNRYDPQKKACIVEINNRDQ